MEGEGRKFKGRASLDLTRPSIFFWLPSLSLSYSLFNSLSLSLALKTVSEIAFLIVLVRPVFNGASYSVLIYAILYALLFQTLSQARAYPTLPVSSCCSSVSPFHHNPFSAQTTELILEGQLPSFSRHS